jgi:hypothetical protein
VALLSRSRPFDRLLGLDVELQHHSGVGVIESQDVTTPASWVPSDPNAGSVTPAPRSKDAELVTFRVGQDDPCLDALADIGPRGAEGEEPLDLCVLVVGTEVEVQPVLARLALRHRDEEKPRKAVFVRSDLELVGLVVDHYPAERFLPPAAKRHWIFRVNVNLLPFKTHVLSIGRMV